MKSVAILQSNYIPWKGYFDLIAKVDEFIFYDEVLYTKQDWRNRNKIKTRQGSQWLTIPVMAKDRIGSAVLISAVAVANQDWCRVHWERLCQSYEKAPFFKQFEKEIGALYEQSRMIDRLCEINHLFTAMICNILGIKTTLSHSKDFELAEDRNLRLVNLVKAVGGDHYLSGPAAKDYLNEELFHEHGIDVEWMDYSNYSEYPQLFPPFEHGVTVLDLLFNTGTEAQKYMKYVCK